MDARIAAIVYKSWTPADRRDLFDWCYDNVVLAGSYAKPGRLNLTTSPWLRRPAESLMNHRVQRVNLLAGVQTFKSGLGQAYNQYRISEDPAQIMHNFQTEDVAKDMWRKRIEPTMEASRATREIMPLSRMKRSRNVISFPGCDYTVQGGGKNESNLQTDSFQIVNNDEVWMWDHGNIGQAEARADAFGPMRKILNSAQASLKDTEWDQVFNAGLVHTLTVKCPSCAKRHPLLWSYKLADGSWAGVVWERKKYLDGTPNVERAMLTVHYRCPLCGHHHDRGEVAMRQLVSTADYSTDYPRAAYGEFDLSDAGAKEARGNPGTHSYHWPSWVAVPLEQLVEDWLKADHAHKLGDISAKKDFYLKKCAIFWSEEMNTDKIVLQLSGYSLGESYAGETVRFGTADYQEGRGDDTPHYWVVVRAWIKGMGSSGLIWCGRVESEEELVETWHTYGVAPDGVVVDGGDKQRMIAAMCSRHGWSFLIGSDKESFPHRLKRKGKSVAVTLPYSAVQRFDTQKGKGRARYVKYVTWSNPTIKDMLHRLRAGSGVPWELPNDVPEWYGDQLDSEYRQRINSRGQWKYRWVPKSKGNPNNHIWDCECMQLVRAMIAGVIPFDADLTERAEKDIEATANAAVQRRKTKKQEDARQLLLVDAD